VPRKPHAPLKNTVSDIKCSIHLPAGFSDIVMIADHYTEGVHDTFGIALLSVFTIYFSA
jgi:hypothetical protein